MKNHPRPSAAKRREARRQLVREEAAKYLAWVESTQVDQTPGQEDPRDVAADEAARLQLQGDAP